MSEPWEDDYSWKVIDSYFEANGMVRQQIDSFDRFMDYGMQAVIDEQRPLEFSFESKDKDPRVVLVEIKFGTVSFGEPSMKEHGSLQPTLITPNIARLRHLSYSVTSFLTVTRTLCRLNTVTKAREDVVTTTTKCELGDIPLMLRSKACVLTKLMKQGQTAAELGEDHYDPGGYFIVNGSERVLVGQERINTNQIYVFSTPRNFFEAQIRSVAEKSAKSGLALYLRCYRIPPRDTHSKLGPILRCTLPYCKKEVSIIVVFRALGVIADGDIMEQICYDTSDRTILELLLPTMEDSQLVRTQEAALELIGSVTTQPAESHQDRVNHAARLLRDEFLPHLGTNYGNEKKKAFFFGYMVRKLLLTHMGRRPMDDRDHFANKRMVWGRNPIRRKFVCIHFGLFMRFWMMVFFLYFHVLWPNDIFYDASCGGAAPLRI